MRPSSSGRPSERLAADARGARRFRLETDRGTIRARDVIVATGAFHTPEDPGRGRRLRAADPPGPCARLPQPRVAAARRRAPRRVGADRGPARRGAAGAPVARSRCPSGTAAAPRDATAVATTSGGSASSSTRGRDPRDATPDRRRRCRIRGCGSPATRTCRVTMAATTPNLRQFAVDGIRLVGRFEGAEGERARLRP